MKVLIEFHLARLRVPRAVLSRAVASMKQDEALPSLISACTIDLWIHLGGLLSTQEPRAAGSLFRAAFHVHP